jgi:hypothetical protein
MTDGASFDDLIAAANSGDTESFRAAISSLSTDQTTRLLLEIVKHQWALIDITTSLSLGDVEYVYRTVELLLSGPSRADATIIDQWRYVDEAAADRKLEQLRAEGRTAAKQIGHLRWLSEDEADAIGRAIEEQATGRGVWSSSSTPAESNDAAATNGPDDDWIHGSNAPGVVS